MSSEVLYVTEAFLLELFLRGVRVGVASATKNVMLTTSEATRTYGALFTDMKDGKLIKPKDRGKGGKTQYWRAAEIEALILATQLLPVINTRTKRRRTKKDIEK